MRPLIAAKTVLQTLSSTQWRNQQTATTLRSKRSISFGKPLQYYVMSWGSSINGQQGCGTKEPNEKPRIVESLKRNDVKMITCGESSSIAVTTSSDDLPNVWIWGTCRGAWENVTKAKRLPLKDEFLGRRVKSIKSGQHHVLMLLDNGKVYSFGNGREGQLGHKNVNSLSEPTLIEGIDEEVVSIECGWLHSLAVTESGKLYAWGCSHFNQLGLDNLCNQSVPMLVEALKGIRIKKMAAGTYHTVVLTDRGEVYGFGRGTVGQLGPQRTSLGVDVLPIPEDEEIAEISCGLHHTLMLTKSGDVYGVGGNEEAQLGLGHFGSQRIPTLIPIPRGRRVHKIYSGPFHNFAVTDNELLAWGLSSDFQCTPTRGHEIFPVKVKHLEEIRVEQMAAGWSHSVALVSEEGVFHK